MSSQTPCSGSQPLGTKTRTLKNDRLLRALRREPTDRAALWLMRQAGRYLPEYKEVRAHHPNFMSMCRCKETTTELALQPLRRFSLDAAILFSDILTIPDALDMDLTFIPNLGPKISKSITQPQDISNLPFHEAPEKLTYVYEAVKDLRSALGNRLPLIGFSGSPWSLACYMISGRNHNHFQLTKQFAYQHPVATSDLIEKLAILTTSYLIEQAKSGADILFLIDTWGGILPSSQYQHYVLKPLTYIQQQLKKENLDTPILFYSKGFRQHHQQILVDSNCHHGLALDWTVDLGKTYQALHNSLAIQGNLDPCILLAGPLATQKHTSRMLDAVNPQSGYIASLGHGILPETPIESVHAFIDSVHNHQ